MKTLKLFSVLLLIIAVACSPIKVDADYDKATDFSQYKTYAFLKDGIDKVEISDLDKKRILNAIDAQMQAKGYAKSETPDLLINFFTKEMDIIDVNQYYGYWGYWGWYPYYGPSYVYTSTEGTLYVDLIDAKKKELVWQGVGVGYLAERMSQKEERINEFVTKIMMQFPPEVKSDKKAKK
ncbi:putative lipoprotein [Flavobacterium limnosediminis JC2902]|uniref:Putative lipoprotein n=1 Tax=Flavobacterium limnosediminis JC2902 TaxID=1341181 RepID=V6SS89_9FLAO|nr:DUF4136 domain-containing protein [Flavobacterium limnosediminis]ESU29314.1 putative lipoprotein [Flavobacterium limnosediminis JC2902]